MTAPAANFEGITAGTLLAAVDGPGQSATRHGAAITGVVVGLKTSRWGDNLIVMCDDGSTEYVASVMGPDEKGMGWYVIN